MADKRKGQKSTGKKAKAKPIASAGADLNGKGPRLIGSVINQLMARRGYAQVESAAAVEASVVTVVGSTLAGSIRVSGIKQGTVRVYASDSTTMQELTFLQRKILKQLKQDHPAANITKVRFFVG